MVSIFLNHRLSDASGSMEMTKESEGSIPEDKLDPNDGNNSAIYIVLY